MRRFKTSTLGILLGLLLAQWIWASYLLVHVVKSLSLSDGKIHVEARRAVNWWHFMPGVGVLLLMDPYSHNITINGYGQQMYFNIDMVSDIPWNELHVQEQSGTVSVVDREGKAYSTFQK